MKEAEQARLEAERKAKEAEQTRLEAEKKAKEAAELKAKQEAEQARLEAEKKAKEEADRELWINGYIIHKGGGYQRNHDVRDISPVYGTGTRDLETFSDYQRVKLKDLVDSNNISYGYIEGTKTYDQNIGVIVDKVKDNDKSSYETTKFTKDMNYSLVHKPYATYGVAYLDTHRMGTFITHGDSIKVYGLNGLDNQGNIVSEDVDPKTTSMIGYYASNSKTYHFNDSVKGTATYKGDVVAYTRTNQNGSYFNNKPVLDGDVTLTAKFGTKKEDNVLSGVINSKLLGGQIILAPTALISESNNYRVYYNSDQNNHTRREPKANAEINGQKYLGSYDYQFSGKDLNYITGTVTVGVADQNMVILESNITEHLSENPNAVPSSLPLNYKAVFGAEKQPK
ncbi:hypothetical protein [Mannheimia indoligenes]|uniref:hypothetical protein n=1 Tax=Mannheimia indoligenes TaxID=3103145 RepID=UPI002FE5E611